MKKLLILLIFISSYSFGQDYNYIIVYKNCGDRWTTNNGSAFTENSCDTLITGFESIEKLHAWMNTSYLGKSFLSSNEHNRKEVRLNSRDILAVYDISNSKKLKVNLKREDRVIKKHIEVEEEKWTDLEYEIKP